MSDDDLNAWLIGGDEPLPDDFGLDAPKKETPKKKPVAKTVENTEAPQSEEAPTPEPSEPEMLEETPASATPSDGLDDFGLDTDGFGMPDDSTTVREDKTDNTPADNDFGLESIVLNGLDDPDPTSAANDTDDRPADTMTDDISQTGENESLRQPLPSVGTTIMDESDGTGTQADDMVGTPEGADDPWGGLGGDWNDDSEWDDNGGTSTAKPATPSEPQDTMRTDADETRPQSNTIQEAQDDWEAGWNSEPEPVQAEPAHDETPASQSIPQDDWSTGWEDVSQTTQSTQSREQTPADDTWNVWEDDGENTLQQPEPQETASQDDTWNTWGDETPDENTEPADGGWNTTSQYPEEQYDDSQPDDDDDERDLKPLFKTIGIAVAIILLIGLLAGGGAYMYVRHQNQVAQERQQQVVLAQRKKKNDTINGWKTARKNALELVNKVEKSKHKDDKTLQQYCSDIKDEAETKPKNLKQYDKTADELTESTRKLDGAYSKLVQSDVDALQKQADEQVKKANELRKTAADSADRKNMTELASKLDRMNIGEDNMDEASTLIGKLKDAIGKVQSAVDAKKKADEDAARQEEERKQAEAQQQQAQQEAQQQQQAQQQYTPAPSYTPSQRTYRQPTYTQPSKPSTPSTPTAPSQPDNTGTVGGNVG